MLLASQTSTKESHGDDVLTDRLSWSSLLNGVTVAAALEDAQEKLLREVPLSSSSGQKAKAERQQRFVSRGFTPSAAWTAAKVSL
jgi:SOS response regulatory protein OraA/RecX